MALVATQSFILYRKQSSGNCQKNGYNHRDMKIWKQYTLGVARGTSGGMLRLIKYTDRYLYFYCYGSISSNS